MRVLISACLLGVSCRYDGASKPHSLAAALARCHELVPVCLKTFKYCYRLQNPVA